MLPQQQGWTVTKAVNHEASSWVHFYPIPQTFHPEEDAIQHCCPIYLSMAKYYSAKMQPGGAGL
jgi:hypothetical protein